VPLVSAELNRRYPDRAKMRPADPAGFGEAWDAIRARRNVRQYTDQPIAREYLERILEAGRRAPSAGNWQPWNFADAALSLLALAGWAVLATAASIRVFKRSAVN